MHTDTDTDGQSTLQVADEATREAIEYCRRIQGTDLEVFKLIAGPEPDLSDVPPEYADLARDIEIDHARNQEVLEGIMDAIDFYADYAEALTGDAIADYKEGERDTLLDLISVLRTTEALIHVKKSLPTYGLSTGDAGEIGKEIQGTIEQGAALLTLFFRNDHRYFYDTLGDFNRRVTEVIIALSGKLAGGER